MQDREIKDPALDLVSTVRFSAGDLALFSAASHDCNPLHTSAEYARKTPYGQPVVFGVLGVIACLGKISCRRRGRVSSMTVEFLSPMFTAIDYQVEATEMSPTTVCVKLQDGATKLMQGVFEFEEEEGSSNREWNIECSDRVSIRDVPADRHEEQLTVGTVVRGQYLGNSEQLEKLMERFGVKREAFDLIPLTALLWSSYLVGMEVPGRRALFQKMVLRFQGDAGPASGPLSYEAKIMSLNKLNLLRAGVKLLHGSELVAEGEIRTFVRPDNIGINESSVENFLPRSESLRGKVALVVGGSRGLGAAITTALCLQGCTVLVNFQHSESEARQVVDNLGNAPGRASLLRGDAGEVAWWREVKKQITRDVGRLDFLFCNACPPIVPLRLESNSVERINTYISRAIALVSVPMSVFLDTLESSGGWNVIISSVAVEAPPHMWPHYVAAKAGIERLASVASLQYPAVKFLVVRPPKLKTDLTNGVFGVGEAMVPELAAARIVRRLLTGKSGGEIHIQELQEVPAAGV